MAKPAPQVFSHGGGVLHWREYGSGPPLVLVHGLSGSRRWWRRNLPAFSAHFRVYVVELTGYGSAWRHRALGVEGSADLIGAWLEAQDLQDVTLLGHSMGGQISTIVASRQPERLRALVLACASGLLETDLFRAALQLPRAALTGRFSFIPTVLFDSLRAGPLNVVRSTLDLLGHPTGEMLPAIALPTLVVWGERDALVPAALGRTLAEALPHGQYVEIPRAGHVVMVDEPDRFNREVLAFLNSLERTPDNSATP
ncbi:alpha/beta hydrolase fold protein [Deinococcus proteolyticus MRP]|uniref:Alpha/beta hydrolase fold protein n=1 Tax=Deinococcus proteolyticus (strain ATCC 35074 / DSM 20540 / JCM 6276 / NBRC 101906 / NCIMB 13154 / VKM Ac-1939 / CCM 2703 / MRP) TaxID=693977 RepID=F0RMW4_DEIPM|nr:MULTISPECIES: alpha/beta hydrolase [Deinococcus]ADY26106.1 alpha/beta hydrolase fold protein [Deinococcus proteolyticus MRP]MCY1702226.1 alpha/beta hydrolase [Deinococcus sp. SL84]